MESSGIVHNQERKSKRTVFWAEGLEQRTLLSTVYVDAGAGGSVRDGKSWGTAFRDLQTGLTAAAAGDQIDIAGGTYTPSPSPLIDISATFTLKNGVSVYGGYAGHALPASPDTRDFFLYRTTLSGDIGQTGVLTDNSGHIVTALNNSLASKLDGCTVAGGYAANGNGGGLYVSNCANLTVSNCLFIDDLAVNEGGAVFTISSNVTFADCEFIYDGAKNGAFSVASGNVKIAGCDFTLLNNGQKPAPGQDAIAIYEERNSVPGLSIGVANSILSGTFFDDELIAFEDGTGPAAANDTFANNDTSGAQGMDGKSTTPQFARIPSLGADGNWDSLADDDFGDLRLLPSSGCIDAGNNNYVVTTTDLAGNPRIVDSPNVADTGVGPGPIVDIGAFESVAAPVRYVDPRAAGSNDGSSWANAFTSLQNALASSPSMSRIEIAGGVYFPTSDNNTSVSFVLDGGTDLEGGYAGLALAANPDLRDFAQYATVLSGDLGTPGNNSDNSGHVVVCLGSAQIAGITIEAGNALNSSTGNGGGISQPSGTLLLDHVTFLNNVATNGGAIYSTQTLYWLGTALNPGISETHCIFIGNIAANGGAVYSSGYLNFADSSFERNVASFGGAIDYPYYDSGGTFTRCQFLGNGSPQAQGGAIFCSHIAAAEVYDSIFVGNLAEAGAVFYGLNGNAQFYGDTLAANDSLGTSVYLDGTSGNSSFTFWGGIFDDVNGIGRAADTSTLVNIQYSDVSGGFPKTGDIGLDPLFVRNPNPGADGTWGTLDDDYGNLRLQPSSPCIDAGATVVNTFSTTDLDGNPREVDVPSVTDTGLGTAPIPDMGAYELQPYASVQGIVYTDVNGNGLDDSEPAIANAIVFDDLNNNGSLDDNEPSVTTDANGNYSITGPSGTLNIRAVVPSSYSAFSSPASGHYSLVLPAWGNSTDANFGAYANATINGKLFRDTNGNGLFDAGEPAINGRTVFIDLDNDGIVDPNETSQTSGSVGNDGSFSFVLTPGTYTLQQLLPAGTVSTGSTVDGSTAITVQSGSILLENLGSAAIPTANANGPYAVAEGSSISLSAGGSASDIGRSLSTYEWDVNYDGVTFKPTLTGALPMFAAAVIDGPASRLIALRVTDSAGLNSTVVTAKLTITNVAPTATFAGSTVTLGQSATATFSNAADPSSADVAAGFLYSYDFNHDGVFDVVDSISPTATVPASYLTTTGAHTITGRIKDKDGAATTYSAIVQINAASNAPQQFKGMHIGSTGSHTSGATGDKAFDGNLSTFYDAAAASNTWTGLDLGSAKIVNEVKFAPRNMFGSRMVGGQFQASNSATFSTGVVTLYKITTAPANGSLTTKTFTNKTAYRYYRYLGPANGYCDVAEIQFWYQPPPPALVKLTGKAIGSAAAGTNSLSHAFDGSFSTYFDSTASNGAWVGLDLGSAKVVKQVKYAPRSGFASRMIGGKIQVSNSANFSTGVVTLLTISATPSTNVWTVKALTNSAAYRYIRYLGPNGSFSDIADLEFDG